jgi:hypothetical protein
VSEVVGREVLCPKCGELGRAVLHVAYAKGFRYTYLAVLHYTVRNGKRSVVRHVVKQLRRERAEPRRGRQVLLTEVAKPEEADALRERLRRLEEENERLRKQLAEAQAEAEQLRMALANVRNARVASAGERERLYLKIVFKDKRSNPQIERLGLSPAEVRATALSIMDRLLSEDWVAVRASAWESLVRL